MKTLSGRHDRLVHFAIALLVCICILQPASAGAENCQRSGTRQKQFASPEQAVQALVDASRKDDLKAMCAILGPGSRKLVSSGDSLSDNVERERFVAAFEKRHALEPEGDAAMVLKVGDDDWPLPIPIVKKGNCWRFDITNGKKEILQRRIGRNELRVIEVLDAYVDAQQEYAAKNLSGTGSAEFAQRIISTPGKRDGLYWEARDGEKQSPLGPLIARATREGYATAGGNLSPFYGYYFKVLKGQGEHASGGAYQYVVKGKMILGFALIAYPANYGNSGVMTFMVNQEGIIYEKNLGRDTQRIAEAITLFNPDSSWKKVKLPEAPDQSSASSAEQKQ